MILLTILIIGLKQKKAHMKSDHILFIHQHIKDQQQKGKNDGLKIKKLHNFYFINQK
jgi:hypothetical protein